MRLSRLIASFSIFKLSLLLIIGLALSNAYAQRTIKDQAGAKDHPLVSRYAGSTLFAQGELNFDQTTFFIAPKKEATLDGKIFNYMYFGPSDRTDLEIYRNYQQALSTNGFKIVHKCESAEQCAGDKYYGHAQKWTGDGKGFRNGYSAISYFNNMPSYDPRFLVAQRDSAQGKTTVVLTTISDSTSAAAGGKKYFMQVIEEKAMQTGQVAVTSAEAIRSGVASEGKIAFYGLFFDTGKAQILPASKPQLDEMAKYLQADTARKFHIVGHTDNQGSIEGNITLSQQRAEAVVAQLVRDYKIDAKRIASRGVASFSPMASNENDAGRAKNRRVELVAQ